MLGLNCLLLYVSMFLLFFYFIVLAKKKKKKLGEKMQNFYFFRVAFQILYVFWQIVRLLLRVQEESSVQVHPFGRRGRLDAIQCSRSNRVSVLDTNMGRQLQTIRTMWCSRPDAILGKTSCAADVQPSGRGHVMKAFNDILERRLQLTVRMLG
jgi:hypothetical protein